MKMNTKISFKIIYYIFLIIITFTSNVDCLSNDLIEWNECTELLVKLKKCSYKLHVPKNCDSKQKSELLRCAENINKDIHLCKDPTAIKMINNYIKTYRNSDKLLCDSRLKQGFEKDRRCQMSSKIIVIHIATIVPGTLSEKGCKVIKSVIYMWAVMSIKRGCYELLIKYLEDLFKETDCGHINIDPPTYNDVKTLKTLSMHIMTCWMSHRTLPTCRSTFSNRMLCLKAINLTTVNKHFASVIQSFTDVSKESDKVMCTDKQLRKDFTGHNRCVIYQLVTGILILNQANGLMTEEGCKAAQYNENITMASVNPNCLKMLLDYRAAMDKTLHCVSQHAYIGIAMSTHQNTMTFKLFISIILFVKFFVY